MGLDFRTLGLGSCPPPKIHVSHPKEWKHPSLGTTAWEGERKLEPLKGKEAENVGRSKVEEAGRVMHYARDVKIILGCPHLVCQFELQQIYTYTYIYIYI